MILCYGSNKEMGLKCFSIIMHFHIMLWKFKIILIKIRTYLPYRSPMLSSSLAVQNDIFYKTVRLWVPDPYLVIKLFFSLFRLRKCFRPEEKIAFGNVSRNVDFLEREVAKNYFLMAVPLRGGGVKRMSLRCFNLKKKILTTIKLLKFS